MIKMWNKLMLKKVEVEIEKEEKMKGMRVREIERLKGRKGVEMEEMNEE